MNHLLPKCIANLSDYGRIRQWPPRLLAMLSLVTWRAVWQPNPPQWRVIWLIAMLLILAWPPVQGRSLGMKMVNWLADPHDTLPAMPAPLPFGLDDNGDAVAEHDAATAEYYNAYQSSEMMRVRLKLKTAGDPLEATTQRQILVAIAILSGLLTWRLGGKR